MEVILLYIHNAFRVVCSHFRVVRERWVRPENDQVERFLYLSII